MSSSWCNEICFWIRMYYVWELFWRDWVRSQAQVFRKAAKATYKKVPESSKFYVLCGYGENMGVVHLFEVVAKFLGGHPFSYWLNGWTLHSYWLIVQTLVWFFKSLMEDCKEIKAFLLRTRLCSACSQNPLKLRTFKNIIGMCLTVI